MKKNKCLFSGFFIVFALCFGVLYGGNHTTVNAAMTKKQMEKKIVALKKEIKSLQKKKAAEEKKEKKQAKGTKPIMGEILSTNPYIIYQNLGFSESYYWVENSKYMGAFMGYGSGYVKLTGKYRNYNGITCAVCKAVKVGTKSLKYQDSIEKKKKELKNCQNSLKETVTLSNMKIKVNQKKKIKYKWKYSGKYNNVKWVSSNTKIATIDSKGNIKGHRQGNVTITATCSLSKKKTKCIVYIYDDFHVYANVCDEEIVNDDNIEISKKQMQITCKFSDSSTKDKIIYECDSYGDVASITQDGLLSFEEPGDATIKVSSSYKSIEFSVNYSGSYDEWEDNDETQEWYEYLKIYNASDSNHNIINDGDTVYVNDKKISFDYFIDLDGDFSDIEIKYSCDSDVAEATENGFVTFTDNGIAIISIYSSSDVLLSRFEVVCNGFDQSDKNEEYDDGEYDDGEYDDGEYDDGEYDDGEYDDGEYDDEEYD